MNSSGFIELASAPEGQGQISLESPCSLIALNKWHYVAGVVDALPLIKRSNGVSEAEEDGQLPLGMMPDVKYPDCELKLQTGDIVIFYTDGIIEAENDAEEMYGTERLLNLVAGIDSSASAEEVIQAILQDVAHFVGTAEQYDDMTIVVLKKVWN